jgi:3-oxoacyl-[acyl-carrier protein] reductase
LRHRNARCDGPHIAATLLLEGKVALVTGAGSQIGIGRAIVKAFAAHGAVVAANDAIAADLARTVADLRESGAEASAHPADVADRVAVERMVDEVERLHGRIDVLVSNAGIAKRAPFATMTQSEYRRTLDVNLGGTFNCAQAAVRGMIERGAGRIVNVSSLMGCSWGWDEHVHYNASKAAIEGLTRGLAVELGPMGITVNAVAPGFVWTAQSTSREHSLGPEGLELARDYVPLRRIAEPEEIADVVLFFASDAARYVTGQTLLVDGGVTLGDLRKAFESLAVND